MAEKKDAKKEKKKAPEEEDEGEDHECPEGSPAWVMTFADLVTLLMVFFILLFAMGSIEEEKWKQIKSSMRDALGQEKIPEAGIREGLDVIKEKVLDESTIHAVDEVGAMVAKEVEEIASEVEEFVFKNKLAGKVDVSSDERGAIITISDTVLFPAGKARMTGAGNDIIKQVFDLLQQFSYQVKIEGHTDNSPIKTERFPSNWELSASRAAEVARELVTAGFPPTQLSIEGFAQYRPKVPNDSREGRATNRRIEIVYQRGSIRKHMVDILRR
ncbi:MAG: flagellar motor protein MotB [Nitrospinaceae bacterium]|nr:flagellar motor protein MotB [Nitrospina sp.]MBT5375702.1 flagellar motor protein MotB [Nitrospinaceae bacterium]MBT5868642.1 flagellar motor protein MotB [Nitrospinaceae bacterium]MBT6346575.1 flagellar motor protein MotB [Nitrospina sp.]